MRIRCAHPVAPLRVGAHGFTLIEMLVAITILAIAAGISTPYFGAFVADQRARNAASDLVTSMLTARSEAIKRNADVTIAAVVVGGTANWGAGWVVTGPPDGGGVPVPIDRKDISGNRLTSPTVTATIVFTSSGRISPAGTTASIELRGAAGVDGVTPRCVTVDLGGRPELKRGACT